MITSQDVIQLFIKTGVWCNGSCEIKQKWYPSGLAPRTYFAQGGDAIRVSCYLRNFFNDFTDSFIPTERRARVDGNRLFTPVGGFFLIYDLTSFSSNFHEQISFLTSMSSFFRGTCVNLISEQLSPIPNDLGDLIEEYCETINTRPTYTFSEDTKQLGLDALLFTHNVAGFLGVPGNLSTCTLAHGISVGITTQEEDRQSCAGDDGNVGLNSGVEEQEEVMKTIDSLGIFKEEKMSTTKETGRGSYLKRPFKQVGERGIMTERVDYPLLGAANCMTLNDPRFPELSEDRKKLRVSLAASCAKLFRDLYQTSGGKYRKGYIEFIISFIKEIYAKGQLPTSGMVRKMYGSDSDKIACAIEAAVVFPISERYLTRDPDVVLAEEFLPWVVDVPVWTEDPIVFHEGEEWKVGDSKVGKGSFVLNKLVALGYVERSETERVTLIGEDARKHFRRFFRDDYMEQEYEYTAILPLGPDQIKAIGLNEDFSDADWLKLFSVDGYGDDSFVKNRYVDLDATFVDLTNSTPVLEDLY